MTCLVSQYHSTSMEMRHTILSLVAFSQYWYTSFWYSTLVWMSTNWWHMVMIRSHYLPRSLIWVKLAQSNTTAPTSSCSGTSRSWVMETTLYTSRIWSPRTLTWNLTLTSSIFRKKLIGTILIQLNGILKCINMTYSRQDNAISKTSVH